MLREDQRDQARERAQAHALLVEAVAMAVRASPEAIQTYTRLWRQATWLDSDTAPPAPAPPPLLDLASHPLFAGAAAAAARGSAEPAPPAGPPPVAAPSAPVYQVRKAGRG